MEMELLTITATGRGFGHRVTKHWRNRKFSWWQKDIWTIEPIQNIVSHHGLDCEAEIIAAITAEIILESEPAAFARFMRQTME